MTQAVDPVVSRVKFDRAVAAYRAAESRNIGRGWWLLRAEFPFVEVAFITPLLNPRTVLLAVRIDFSDFDVLPLSVSFIDAIDRRILTTSELLTVLPRLDSAISPATAAMMQAAGAPITVVPLIQPQPDQTAFLCLPGVREYHANSAHSGDPWELHRGTGEGDMMTILETLWRYGPATIDQLSFTIQAQYHARQIPA